MGPLDLAGHKRRGYDGILLDIESRPTSTATLQSTDPPAPGEELGLTEAVILLADVLHTANPASIIAWSSRRTIPQLYNSSATVDWVRVSEHLDYIQPMEYCDS